jgi:hypothetical protein
MATYTIIGGDQKPYSSVTPDDIRRWIADGRLNAQSLAREENDTEWRPLSAFPEFADALASQTAAPLPPAPSLAVSADWQERDYELDIGGCISRGWGLVKNNFWPVVGVTALVLLINIGINQIIGLFTRPVLHAMLVQHQFSAGEIFIVLMAAIISAPIYAIFTAGLFKYYLKLIRGEDAGIGDAFSGFGPSIGQLILLGLIMNTLVMIGCVLCLIPGIYLSVAWYFAIPLIIDRRMNFWAAMECSRKMVNKHWFLVFAFLLVIGLLAAAGVIACCIGIFVTMPIFFASMMCAYETIFFPAGAKAT